MSRREVIPIKYSESDLKEEALLTMLYECSDGSYNSYTLARRLHPSIDIGTKGATQAFADTRAATEGLILKGFARGVRMTGADGVYFEKLKLTPKGERKAIEYKTRPRRIVVEYIGKTESTQ